MKTICPPGYHDVRFTFVRFEHSVCRDHILTAWDTMVSLTMFQ